MKREEIIANRGDLSPFLTHLTRDLHGLGPMGTFPFISARNNLISILKSSTLQGRSSYSYFKYKKPATVLSSWLNSVCLTETPLRDIDIQLMPIHNRQQHFQPYGLAFFENSVRRANGNPVLYVDSSNPLNIASLDAMRANPNIAQFKDILHLYQTFGKSFSPRYPNMVIDFRWEREWRIPGNFTFNIARDVAFGLCPDAGITFFESLTGNKIPFVDPRNYPVAKQKLAGWRSLKGYTF